VKYLVLYTDNGKTNFFGSGYAGSGSGKR